MRYRAEIDGLRAVAVLSVLAFHAGVPLFAGGYVGVDVFFVISGFLIASIVAADLDAGRFTFSAFYARRARRILPALLVVVAACAPAAWLLLEPREMKDFAGSALAVSTFTSNFWFYAKTGYFETASPLKPLLHTWSLGVEEQFYLLFPALFVILNRGGRRGVYAGLAGCAAASFVLSVWAGPGGRAAAFYLLPARAWEILAGALLALAPAREQFARADVRARDALSLLGLAAIAFAVVRFDALTPVPGLAGLVPVGGTLLVLAFAGEGSRVGRLLGHRAAAAIGLISYSVYLWHQPLFAFARHAAGGPPGAMAAAGLTVSTLALAALTWWTVERPLRAGGSVAPGTALRLVAAGTAAVAVFAAAGLSREGFPSRFDARGRELLAERLWEPAGGSVAAPCYLDHDQAFEDLEPGCLGSGKGATMVWGDSFAAALADGLRESSPGMVQVAMTGCPPLVGAWLPTRHGCKELNTLTLNLAVSREPRTLILAANWDLYMHEDRTEFYVPGLLDDLRRTVELIRHHCPGCGVTVVGAMPQWGERGLPSLLARSDPEEYADGMMPLPDKARWDALDALLALAVDGRGAAFFSPLRSMCRGERCRAVVPVDGAEVPIAWDFGHPTKAGAAWIAKKLRAEVRS